MFIDKANIHLKAGKGGDGAVAFRREKYVPAGGPAGGDGGKGGNVVFIVDEGMKTLMDFRYKKHYRAENGEDGKNKNMFGKDGGDMILKVPPGTIIKDEKTGVILADLTEKDKPVIVARGGNGGKGNSNFKTSTRQAPNFAIAGEAGEERSVILELKLIADVGLIGFPNVGKSTLLSVATSATPKIANYHFTTIAPNLGVVKTKYGDSFVLADIPGLIEGAHKGTGLGHEFLRHVERTKLLIHVLDSAGVEGRDPIEDYEKINEELKEYNLKLWDKPQIVAANKVDIPSAEENIVRLKSLLEGKNIQLFTISAATGKGIDELMVFAAKKLKEIEETITVEATIDEEEKLYKFKPEEEKLFTIAKEGNTYIIEGNFVERLVNSTNFDDMDSLAYFQKVLRKRGIIDELKELGIQEEDNVKIGEIEFQYYD
ncbi:GTPase ObgE [Alkaliphilus pronyensis]|uniref:GTPase Obg n=1 Tax=Alkaliphilus pronyensis TaxID=1482732 RepID=A0A6I0FIH1_9FIRM|nr:GTPase ObgE [Alkaliphilus pronyensis]KAB3535941.1 GTPase ObgE [Alkaliphilus pronyensis]